MTVVAECLDCGDVHPLGDRGLEVEEAPGIGHLTTLCPACGSPSYSSDSTGERITKSESERIRDAIKDVEGVGEKNRENIVEAFSTLAEIRAADADALEAVEGVGRVVAERVVDELREPIGGFQWVGEESGSA